MLQTRDGRMAASRRAPGGGARGDGGAMADEVRGR